MNFKEIAAYSLGLFGFQAIVGLLNSYQAELTLRFSARTSQSSVFSCSWRRFSPQFSTRSSAT